MANKKSEAEIDELFETLGDLEDIDPLYIPRELVRIRHFVFFTHERIENSLDSLYAEHVFDWDTKGRPAREEAVLQRQKLAPILTGVSFKRKMEKYHESKMITLAMKNMFNKVNIYRNWFSHGLGYNDKLTKLDGNRNEQKQLLGTLVEALNLLNEHFRVRGLKLEAITKQMQEKE